MMPVKPKRPCAHPGCRELSVGRYCSRHSSLYEKQRGYASERGYTKRWQIARKRYLKNHPLCMECHRAGRLIEAAVVDHIIPHRGDQKLFWDENNWQALCKRCHDRKTGKHDQYKNYGY